MDRRKYKCVLIGASEGIGCSLQRVVRTLAQFEIFRISRAFLTVAEGPNQPHIWNLAAVVRSEKGLSREKCKDLELQLGRRARPRKDSPREVDIDLLFEFQEIQKDIWKITETYQKNWLKKYYSRLPIFDLCRIVETSDSLVVSENMQFKIDDRILAIWPRHLLKFASWTPDIHYRIARKLIAYINQSHNKKDIVPIGAFIVANGEIVSSRMSEGNIIRHAEILALGDALGKIGIANTKNLWLYTNLQPCIACLTTASELGIAGCAWMVDYSREYEYLYKASYNPLWLTSQIENPLIIVRGIMSGAAKKQFDGIVGKDLSKNRGSLCAWDRAKHIGVKAFYNKICFQYRDPIIHPISYYTTAIHEQLLEELRNSVKGLIIDLGCGCQKPVKDSIGIDFSSDVISSRKLLYPESIGFCRDVNRLGNEIRGASGIFAGLLIDHIENLKRVFSNIYKVSKPGAKLVITVFDPTLLPIDKYDSDTLCYYSLSGRAYSVPFYRRSIKDILRQLSDAGWDFASEIITHYTVDSDYRLLELRFSKRNL